jgi:hypothetical protein
LKAVAAALLFSTITNRLSFCFILVLDEGRDPPTHHLPVGFTGDSFSASAPELRCRLVVEQSSSRKAEFLICCFLRQKVCAYVALREALSPI